MQQPNAGSTRARSALRWCPCATCIWLLHPAPILVPKMVLTHVPLALVVFFFGALAHLLMCAQMNRHTLQLAMCGGGGGCCGIFMWWL